MLDILEAMNASRGEVGVSELARQVGISKGSVHETLGALKERGYVDQNPATARYSLGIKLWALGCGVDRATNLRRKAAPHLRALTNSSGESAHLSVYDDGEVVYIDKVETPNPVQAPTRVGGRAPSHAPATGKLLLAFQSPDEIATVIERGLERFTDRTISTATECLEELERIREQKYALNNEEWRPGVVAVATGIFGGDGSIIAAVSIAGPAYRFAVNDAMAFAPRLQETCDAIAADLSLASPSTPAAPL